MALIHALRTVIDGSRLFADFFQFGKVDFFYWDGRVGEEMDFPGRGVDERDASDGLLSQQDVLGNQLTTRVTRGSAL